jgi:hypothetical protein
VLTMRTILVFLFLICVAGCVVVVDDGGGEGDDGADAECDGNKNSEASCGCRSEADCEDGDPCTAEICDEGRCKTGLYYIVPHECGDGGKCAGHKCCASGVVVQLSLLVPVCGE